MDPNVSFFNCSNPHTLNLTIVELCWGHCDCFQITSEDLEIFLCSSPHSEYKNQVYRLYTCARTCNTHLDTKIARNIRKKLKEKNRIKQGKDYIRHTRNIRAFYMISSKSQTFPNDLYFCVRFDYIIRLQYSLTSLAWICSLSIFCKFSSFPVLNCTFQ